ncbi:MAG: hypothetical protein IJT59_04615 [Desulfovibrionaceae bacterium]|nr:hypothetical protein [Desulfovibrionaceae bacterium]
MKPHPFMGCGSSPHPSGISMKRIFYLSIIIIAILGLVIQFGLKGSIEKELTQVLTANMTNTGFTLKEPLKVDVSPLTSTLKISPFQAKLKSDMGECQLNVQTTTIDLTLNGLFSSSAVAHLVLPKQGPIEIFRHGKIDAIDLNTDFGKLHLEDLVFEHTTIGQEELQKLLDGRLSTPKTSLICQEIYWPKTRMDVPDENATVTLGPIRFHGYSQTAVAEFSAKDLQVKNPTYAVSFKELNQKRIRVMSEDEANKLVQRLNNASQEQKAFIFLALLLGTDPLVGQTSLEQIKIESEGKTLNLGGISLKNNPDTKEVAFQMRDLNISKQDIEFLAGTAHLPLPADILFSFETVYRQESASLSSIATGVDLQNLFSFNFKANAHVNSLENLLKGINQTKFQNLEFIITDKTLLARITSYFAPKDLSSPSEFLLKEITPDQNAPQAEIELAEKLRQFVTKPGRLVLKSHPNVTLLLPDLEEKKPEEFDQMFSLEVEPGNETLDQQVEAVRSYMQ